ncbi:lipoprotein-releasing system ATP-binding protein LolD [Planctomycetota bacterium]|nr:lipoprotein-releasing system ATP-binding protein LolD [Planctomycetota bacterium]
MSTSKRTATGIVDPNSIPVLAAENVRKNYWLGKRAIPVLRGIDLRVYQGEMVALLGASGAGKSTLMHVLGLLDTPTDGQVLYDGKPAHSLSINQRAALRHRHTGFVFQFYHLIPELTALQNVVLARMMQISTLHYWRERRAVRAEAVLILTQFGLGERLSHRPSELSGGERQRVAIARALIAKPRIVLADEPTGNLDSHTADGVMELLFEINQTQQLAFLLVTHNEEIAARCHRMIRLKDGLVVG